MGADRRDVIVIGGGIAGLGVSAMLARAGRDVLTLEHAKDIGGRAYSYSRRGHITNIGGPRAGLENGKVDELFAAVGREPGERDFFDDIVHYEDGEFASLAGRAAGVPHEDLVGFMTAVTSVQDDDLAGLDAISARDWLAERVTHPVMVDLARFASIVLTTLPRLEDIAASSMIKSLQIILGAPRVYVAAHGYGDFMAILADASQQAGGEVRTLATVKEIVVEDGRARGVVVAGRDGRAERIDAELVVTAFPIWDLFDLADRSLFPAEFVDQVAGIERRTAIFGVTAALSEPLYDGKFFVLTDARRAGHPLAGFMASNVTPSVSPEGEHLFEVCCQCDIELGSDKARLDATIAALKEDLDEMFPDWRRRTIWSHDYFHWEEPARTPRREGVFRPGSRAPGVEGLWFCGDTVESRALPGLECAADSTLVCARRILEDAA